MKRTIAVVTVIVLAVFSLVYFETPFAVFRPVFHKQIVNFYAQKYKVDPLFVTAIIKEESNFLRKARSRRGAIGLMQIMPATARELAPEIGNDHFADSDLEIPSININLGMYYLSKLQKQFRGDQVMVLAAYNAGIGTVASWQGGNPDRILTAEEIPYRATRAYVKNVLRTYRWLKQIQKIKRLFRGKTA